MARKISQREARRLQQEVRRMVEQRNQERRTYTSDYPGVLMAVVDAGDIAYAKVETAKRLEFPVVVALSEKHFYFHAVK